MVLANLEQLQIRALFSQLSSSVSLRRVGLETATATATGVRASNVELCFCPANYLGDSCQVRGKSDSSDSRVLGTSWASKLALEGFSWNDSSGCSEGRSISPPQHCALGRGTKVSSAFLEGA